MILYKELSFYSSSYLPTLLRVYRSLVKYLCTTFYRFDLILLLIHVKNEELYYVYVCIYMYIRMCIYVRVCVFVYTCNIIDSDSRLSVSTRVLV